MFWRKLKLDWSYAIGELIIVTVGVLIALGVNQWQQDHRFFVVLDEPSSLGISLLAY
jgi:hypothetical protein